MVLLGYVGVLFGSVGAYFAAKFGVPTDSFADAIRDGVPIILSGLSVWFGARILHRSDPPK